LADGAQTTSSQRAGGNGEQEGLTSGTDPARETADYADAGDVLTKTAEFT
jgi:hypothetical protein